MCSTTAFPPNRKARMLLAFSSFVLGALILLAPTYAIADTCESTTRGWLDRCRQRGGLPMRVVGCPEGRVVVHVGDDAASSLDVEISRSARATFRSVNGYGLSPVGEFADWSNEPEARRAALEQVAACLEQEPTLDQEVTGGEPGLSGANRRSSVPWLLVGAWVVLLAALIQRHRARRKIAARGRGWAKWARQAWRGVGPGGLTAMLAGTTAVVTVRMLLVPARFFHQNGQGPFWIEIAMRDAGTSRYGPGYAELFRWVARWGNPPDVAVFSTMAVGSALIPWFGWLIARRAGAPVCAAWVVAGWLAVHPLAIRLAQSESYLGAQLILLFAAAAVLAGARRVRSLSFILQVVAAGLLLAQVVRIHPTSWIPAAMIPLVLLCRSGSPRSRLLESTVAGIGIGAIVLAASGNTVWDVLSGSLGQQWRPSTFFSTPELSTVGWVCVLASLGLLLASRNRLHAVLPLAVGGALVLSAAATDLLGENHPWVADAYRLQFAPTLLAASVALLRASAARWPRRRALAVSAAVVILGALVIGVRYQAHTVIPTDAEEQRWAMEWRSRLPKGASVDYLARAGIRVVSLPIYESSPIQAYGRTPEALWRLARPAASLAFYYRSSLCFTPEGAAACRAFERDFDLEALETRSLPSQGSLPWLPLNEGPIEVGVFRVRGSKRSLPLR